MGRDLVVAATVVLACAASYGISAEPSMAKFTRSDTSAGSSFSSDTVKPATAVAVTSDALNELDLAWTPSLTSYVTGYKVQRSTSASGPWTQVGTIGSRTTKTFTNTATGITRWYYRLDATGKGWTGSSTVVQAPVAKGSYFHDGFAQTAIIDRDINAQVTEDGDSVWSVWSGGIFDGTSNAAWGASDTVMNIGVIETPTQNAHMYGRDFDGVESLILRAKDSKNYIAVGGAGPQGSFEIAEVRNGVRTVLKSATLADGSDIRLDITGSTITVYQGATDDLTGGTQVTTATSSYLLGDAAAHWFGIGFATSHGGITDVKFHSMP